VPPHRLQIVIPADVRGNSTPPSSNFLYSAKKDGFVSVCSLSGLLTAGLRTDSRKELVLKEPRYSLDLHLNISAVSVGTCNRGSTAALHQDLRISGGLKSIFGKRHCVGADGQVGDNERAIVFCFALLAVYVRCTSKSASQY
jgi:hypothetical protein